MSKKERSTIVGILGCLFCMIIVVMCYLWTGLKAQRMDISSLRMLSGENGEFAKIIEVEEEKFGVVHIVFETEKPDMRYPFFNYTLGAGEGEYKNISLLVYDEASGEAWKMRTYSSVEETDTYIAYVSSRLVDKNDRFAVLFQDLDGEQYLYKLEGNYALY